MPDYLLETMKDLLGSEEGETPALEYEAPVRRLPPSTPVYRKAKKVVSLFSVIKSAVS